MRRDSSSFCGSGESGRTEPEEEEEEEEAEEEEEEREEEAEEEEECRREGCRGSAEVSARPLRGLLNLDPWRINASH
jgi:hypothetical protein